MTATPTLGVVLTATLCLTSACAGGTADDAPAGGTASASSLVTAPTTPSPTAPSPTTGAAPHDLLLPPPGDGTVLTGTVGPGAEPGCLLLQASGVLHQLVGAVDGVAAGQRVTVQGRPDPTLATTCQQGTPFVVTSVAPA